MDNFQPNYICISVKIRGRKSVLASVSPLEMQKTWTGYRNIDTSDSSTLPPTVRQNHTCVMFTTNSSISHHFMKFLQITCNIFADLQSAWYGLETKELVRRLKKWKSLSLYCSKKINEPTSLQILDCSRIAWLGLSSGLDLSIHKF